MTQEYSIGIVGGGSVGLTFAALLSEHSEVFVKVRRASQANAINARGICFRRRNGEDSTYLNVNAVISGAELATCDAVIVAVKSYDTEAVAVDLAKVLAPSTVVLTLQNGLQAFALLTDVIERPERIFAGVTYVGAHRDDDRTVVNGDNLTTVVDEKIGKLAEVMSATLLDVEVRADSRQAVWDKMVLNVGQNALSALTDLTFGEMYESESCLGIARRLLDEFVTVAKAEGIEFDYDVMDRLRDNWRGSSFRPSMWQDLQLGRRTEIDAINGAVCELGAKWDVPTPANEMVVGLIRALEEKAQDFSEPALRTRVRHSE